MEDMDLYSLGKQVNELKEIVKKWQESFDALANERVDMAIRAMAALECGNRAIVKCDEIKDAQEKLTRIRSVVDRWYNVESIPNTPGALIQLAGDLLNEIKELSE